MNGETEIGGETRERSGEADKAELRAGCLFNLLPEDQSEHICDRKAGKLVHKVHI